MTATIIITISLILFGSLFPKNKYGTYALLLLVYLLFAFEYSEGDYEGYLLMYDNWKTLETEKFFLLLSDIGHSFKLSFDQVRYFVCVFELFVIGRFVKKYSLAPGLVLASFFVFPALMAAELFRWLLGMSFVILGLNYLITPQNRLDYIKYLICVICAALSHSSCWFFLVYYLILIKNRKVLLLSIVSILILFLLLGNTGYFFDLFSKLTIREHLIDKYETGLYSNKMGMILALFKIGVIILFGWISVRKTSVSQLVGEDNKNMETSVSYFNNRVYYLLLISSLMLVPMFFSSVSARLLHVPLLLVYISYSNRRFMNKKRPICVEPLLLSMIFLILALFIDTDGLGPIITFTSHFREGFLIRFLETIS